MSISLSEELISIGDLPDYLKKRTGKKPHIASVYRWLNAGLKGVKLESIAVGGARFTSLRALNEFFNRVTYAKRSGQPQFVNADMQRLKHAREKQTEREAEELGI